MLSLSKKVRPAVLLAAGIGLAVPGAAQQPGRPAPARAASPKTTPDTTALLLDFSRPASPHLLLGTLAGTWHFQDAKRPFVQGTLTRKPLYDGRFYQVETTGGKLPLPVANGQLKEDNYRSEQTEGFDNGKKLYVATFYNNHIGSGIDLQTGTYDPATKAITYQWDDELLPGLIQRNRRVLRIIDANHYVEEYCALTSSKARKVRELDYTRVSEK